MSNKKVPVRVITRDSLGLIVADYQTYLHEEVAESIKANLEAIDDLCWGKDIEIDGELGYREYQF